MKSRTIFSSFSSSFFFFLFSSIFVSWSLLLSHRVVVVASSLNSEGEALLSLMNKFSYFDEYSTKLDWNLSGSSTPCQWSGVSCNIENTHIVSLELSDYGISGQLGPQIGQLKYLESVDLSFNHFNGSIPVELWNCSRLQHLDLTFNNFTGELPEALKNLHQLNYCDISINHLSGRIPESWFHISGLEYIDLSGNSLTGSIPLNLGNATKMQLLRLTGNSLYGIIPASIANCTKLEILYLDRNALSGNIPLGLWRIPTLVHLYAYNNNLSGELPVEMTTGLHHLAFIDLNTNQFSGLIPKALGINGTSLKYVSLSRNNFTGEIPPNLCFGKQLRFLHLAENQFHGSIPPSYTTGNCYSLHKIDLQGNKLNGSLPHFETNSSLNSLDISRNSIQGQIPSSICNLMSSLVFLDLSENQMNGTLLHCLGDLNRLITLNLRNNHFSGTIFPNFTGDQWDTIDLNGNHFEGKIPRSLGIHTPNLTYLDLGNNQLNDTFPSFLEILSRLEILVLRSNKLYGPLKRRLHSTNSTFRKLKVLDISSNYFTGDLPLEFILGLDAIRHIDPVQYTNDDEHINYPETSSVVIHKGREMGLNRTFLNNFRAIDMSNNTFQGTIPESIGDLLNLTMLNLSNNHFNGCIPSSLGNLAQLESLDLSYNRLSGEIPRHLTDMHYLAALNLSYNNLTGQIPDEAGQFSTFTNDSFRGNSGLCGLHFLRECGDPNEEETQSYEDYSNNNPWSFGWEPVVIGYGCGVLIGLVIQYFLFTKAFLYRWLGRRSRGGR